MSVIKFNANFVFDNCTIKGFDATVSIAIPHGIDYKQVDKNGNIRGITINLGYISCGDDSHDCQTIMTILSDPKIDDGTVGIQKISDDNDDYSVDDNDDLFNFILSNIKVEIDSHFNCYCKTQKVCGCGCDPLHDGW